MPGKEEDENYDNSSENPDFDYSDNASMVDQYTDRNKEEDQEEKTEPKKFCYEMDKRTVYNRLYKYYLEQEQVIFNSSFNGKFDDKNKPYPTCKSHAELFEDMNSLLTKTRKYVSDSQSWPEIFMFLKSFYVRNKLTSEAVYNRNLYGHKVII